MLLEDLYRRLYRRIILLQKMQLVNAPTLLTDRQVELIGQVEEQIQKSLLVLELEMKAEREELDNMPDFDFSKAMEDLTEEDIKNIRELEND